MTCIQINKLYKCHRQYKTFSLEWFSLFHMGVMDDTLWFTGAGQGISSDYTCIATNTLIVLIYHSKTLFLMLLAIGKINISLGFGGVALYQLR